MTDGESLYRAILLVPADDAPRLVYADWLEERGDLERAELIRHMVHFPRDRAGYRPPKPASLYWPDAPPWVGYGVRRGFVAEIGLSTPLFLADAAELFARHPITRVNLLDRGRSLSSTARSPPAFRNTWRRLTTGRSSCFRRFERNPFASFRSRVGQPGPCPTRPSPSAGGWPGCRLCG